MTEEVKDKKNLLKVGIELKLRSIFKNKYFDVCGFKKIIKSIGGDEDVPDDIEIFHCVDYSDMGAEVKAMLFKRCVETMAQAVCWDNFITETCDQLGLNDNKTTVTIQLEHPAGFFKRLLG